MARRTSPSSTDPSEPPALHLPLTPRIAALAASAVALLVYLLTMNRSIGTMDSGEIAAATCTLGIMHPTGYPTLTMLGYIVAALSPLRPIMSLNVLAAVLCAIGVGIMTLMLTELMRQARVGGAHRRAKSRPNRHRAQQSLDEHDGARPWFVPAIAGLTALFIGFTGIWWEQATGFEVYALQSLLLPLVTLLFMRFVVAERERRLSGEPLPAFSRAGTWFALALGLAFTNHMMTIFLAPAFLVHYFWSLGINGRAFRRLVSLVPPFLAGLLPYLYLPIRSSMTPRFNWGRPDTWQRFVDHITGRFAWEWMFSSSDIYATQTRYFFDRLPADVAYVGIAFALLGLVLLLRSNVRLAIWSLLAFAACVAYAGGYRIYDVELYYATALVPIGMWIACALVWLGRRSNASVALTIGAILVIGNIALHYSENDLSGYRLSDDYVWNILKTAPPGSMIFSSDAATFVTGSNYLQEVAHVRKDVTVINHDYLSLLWYLDELRDRRPDLMGAVAKEVSAYRAQLQKLERSKHGSGETVDYFALTGAYNDLLQAMVAWQMKHGEVLIVGDVETAFGQHNAVPWGFGYRLVDSEEYLPQPFPHYRYHPWKQMDPLSASIYEQYGRRLVYRASYEAEHGHDSLAARYRAYALTFDPGYNPDEAGPIPLDGISQIRATAEFFARLRNGR